MERKNDIVSLNEIEHCLLRPGIYIGSVKEEPLPTLIYTESGKIESMPVLQIPGLLKIFDEIISNAVDEAIRTGFKHGTKISVGFDGETITVEDNGRGLPICKNDEDVWVPESIFTKLRTGSNFDDEHKGNVMGMNGFGATLTNIYSRTFKIDTANGKQRYRQEFENHTYVKRRPKITDDSGSPHTAITFVPNYDYFKITDDAKKNLWTLIEKRIRDLALCYPELVFRFNGKKITGKNFKEFLESIHSIHERSESESCRLGVFYSDTEFQHLSFVNGAETRRGGTHIDYVSSSLINSIREYIKKKHKIEVKPIDIKSKLFIVFSMRMKAPQFDTQTKEKLDNEVGHFKELVDGLITKKFLESLVKNEEIIAPIVEAYKLKEQVKENIELKKEQKKLKKVKIVKLIDATARNRNTCQLFFVEGDGAGATFLSVRNENCGALKLKGKIPNITEMKPSEIVQNEELSNIMASLGVEIGKNAFDYESDEWIDLKFSDGTTERLNVDDEIEVDGIWIKAHAIQ